MLDRHSIYWANEFISIAIKKFFTFKILYYTYPINFINKDVIRSELYN